MNKLKLRYRQKELVYPTQYVEYRDRLIERTKAKRVEFRTILDEHLKRTYGEGALCLDNICLLGGVDLLLSASRGGSSITADILRQQARSASGGEKIILSMPGEQRPYLELAKLTPPFKEVFSDKLDAADAQPGQVNSLLSELLAEIGYPISQTSDLRGYAITIYGRLLLQWPSIDFGQPLDAIQKIERSIGLASTDLDKVSTYVNDYESQVKLMNMIQMDYPRVDLRFYDGLNEHAGLVRNIDASLYDTFIEEPPFILPSPWHYASRHELTLGRLLLKDPSDVWRINFWQKVFHGIPLSYVHLTRNVYESINGLCDGWKFPFGYVTTRSPQLINVRGYTTADLPSTSLYAKYSTSDNVWNLLLGGEIDLEQIAAQQWFDAHHSILTQVSNDQNYSLFANDQNERKTGFELFRTKPVEIVSRYCADHGFGLTPSLLEAARKMATHHIQVTPGTSAQPSRWKNAPNHEMILRYANSDFVIELTKTLGYSV